jgi:hypothetical protein
MSLTGLANGVVCFLAVLTVLTVLWWAIRLPEMGAQNEPGRPAPPRAVSVLLSLLADSTVRYGRAHYPARHASAPVDRPRVSGRAPWGEAPKPPSQIP